MKTTLLAAAAALFLAGCAGNNADRYWSTTFTPMQGSDVWRFEAYLNRYVYPATPETNAIIDRWIKEAVETNDICNSGGYHVVSRVRLVDPWDNPHDIVDVACS